jgi:hypothetical protein
MKFRYSLSRFRIRQLGTNGKQVARMSASCAEERHHPACRSGADEGVEFVDIAIGVYPLVVLSRLVPSKAGCPPIPGLCIDLHEAF